MFRAPNRLSWIAAFLIGTATPAGAGEVELISRIHPRYVSGTGSGESEVRSISANGRYLLFSSEAPNLVPGQIDGNAGPDIFVYDRVTRTVELISRSAGSSTSAANSPSSDATISGDGRFVAFSSLATDLVPGQQDTNQTLDVFIHDRVTGATELVSHVHSSRTETGSRHSSRPAISANGRFIAFQSEAPDLMEEPGRHFGDVFLYDRISGKTELVSRPVGPAPPLGITASYFPAISANGRFITFLSYAEDLVPGQRDTGIDGPDVFLYDRVAKKMTLVSHAASSPTTGSDGFTLRRPAISADGSTVVFESSGWNLVPNQRNPSGGINQQHLFLFHHPTGTTSLVNHAASSPTTRGNGATGSYAVSVDGSVVAFTSAARNLVSGQAGQARRTLNAFLYQRATGRITLLSGAGGSPTVAANASSAVRGLSADGNRVLLQSEATDLVRGTGDANGATDVFLHDRRTKKTVLVSHGTASNTRTGNRESLGSILSTDGQWVAFESAATDLVNGPRDFNQTADIFLDGVAAGRELASRRAPDLPSDTPQAASQAEAISADGRFVLFTSTSSFLVDGQRDPNGDTDVFLRDRLLGKTVLVSRSAAHPGIAGNAASGGSRNFDISFPAANLSADGRYAVFLSYATDLLPDPAGPPVPDEVADLFLYDRETGDMTRIASGLGALGTIPPLEISADGSSVVFGRDTSVYLYDRAAGTTARISPSDVQAGRSVLSDDGRFVAYETWAGAESDVFLYDRVTGGTTLVTRTAASPATRAGGLYPVLSADGRFVAFISRGTDLVPGQIDPPRTQDVFLYDRLSGTNTLVTHAPGSLVTAAGSKDFSFGGMDLSADGRFLAFSSPASELVPGPADEGLPDIFLFDRQTGAVSQVSRETGSADDAPWWAPSLSADGQRVAFTNPEGFSLGSDFQLYPHQVWFSDLVTGELVLVSEAPSITRSFARGPFLSANGDALAFTSTDGNLVPRDFNVTPSRFVDGYFSHTDAFVYMP